MYMYITCTCSHFVRTTQSSDHGNTTILRQLTGMVLFIMAVFITAAALRLASSCEPHGLPVYLAFPTLTVAT